MDEQRPGRTNIVSHDFGHEKRQKSRRLRRQLDLDALHEANIRDNPLPYLERASERIYQLEKALFEAHLAANEPSERLGRVSVGQSENDRLRACREILASAYRALLVPRTDD